MMMTDTVCIRAYTAPPVDRREILRYAGVRGEAADVEQLLDSCLKELEGQLTWKVCYRTVSMGDTGIAHSTVEALKASKTASDRLESCDFAVLFAATVGLGIDRLITRYAVTSPAKALLFQAIGAERIESLCDHFCAELARESEEQGFLLRPRFSPGYGDLPLTLQNDLFQLLDCPRRIGLSLGKTMLMTPTKSVTAIMGLEKRKENEPV